MKNILTKIVLALAFSLPCLVSSARQTSSATIAAAKRAPRTPASLPEIENLAAPEPPEAPDTPVPVTPASGRPGQPGGFGFANSTIAYSPWGQATAEKSLVIPRDSVEGLGA